MPRELEKVSVGAIRVFGGDEKFASTILATGPLTIQRAGLRAVSV
jgi:hypothetical protein